MASGRYRVLGDVGRKMKDRLNYHLTKFGMDDWSAIVNERKNKISDAVSEWPFWMRHAIKWNPPACSSFNDAFYKRCRGRPRMRWNDNL